MMMGCRERIITRSPFTPSQWEELEQQALVFKYMVSGSPIPQDLISTVQRSLESSLSSDLLLHQLGWVNGYRMAGGYGLRKIDPEPGRCRRTDGKKWRCSKEAYPDSKYCERHMHRGRNRSRKPVEIQSPSSPPSAAATDKPGDILPVTRNALSSWPSETRFIHSPHFSSAQESSNTRLFLESHGFTLPANKAYRKQMDGIKGAADNEYAFLSMKAEAYYPSGLENERQKTHAHHCCNRDINFLGINIGRENDQPKKVMHHFLDESPPPPKEGKSFSNWPINKSELNFSVDTRNNTQLPTTVVPNSLHDFFMTQKW